jgi:hypothetical protein
VASASDEKERMKLKPHVLQVHDFITKHGVESSWDIIDANGRSTPISVLEYCEDVKADVLMIMDDDDNMVLRMAGNEVAEVLYTAEIPVMCVTPKPALYGSGFQAI